MLQTVTNLNVNRGGGIFGSPLIVAVSKLKSKIVKKIL